MFYKKKKTKIGLIVTAAPKLSWPDKMVNVMKGYIPKAKKALEDLGMEVYAFKDLAKTFDECAKQGEKLKIEGVHVLVIYVATWSFANASIIASIKADVPVIVWASSNIDTFGIVGGCVVRGSLEEVGVKNYLIYGDFDDEKVLKKLKMLCMGISGATKLRGMVYGEGGSRCMGMVTSRIDPSQWISEFGIDVDGFDEIDLIRRAEMYSEEEAKKILIWIKNEFGDVKATEKAMIYQIKLYFALREIIKENSYDFVGVKCLTQGGMPACYTTFCLAHALLNDLSDDGFGERSPFVCACEADANGALTMQILNNITNSPAMFTDIFYYDYKENILWCSNCGSQPTDFASSRKDVVWMPQGEEDFYKFKFGGTSPRYIARPGKVTIARMSRVKGKYVMLIASGESIEMSLEKLKKTNPSEPYMFVKLDCDHESFINSVRSNHVHIVFGDYRMELLKTCEVLDIKPILPK